MSPRTFVPLLKAQATLAGLLYAWSLYGFIRFTGRQGDLFADLAVERYLGTIIWYQLRVVPAYVVLWLLATLLTWPVLRHRAVLQRVARRGAASEAAEATVRFPRLRLLFAGAALDGVLGLLSMGYVYQLNPGFLDSLARKGSPYLPGFDWYALHRWHVLDAVTALFAAVAVYAAVTYTRLWWARLRGAQGAGRALWLLPAVAVLGAAGWLLRPPPSPPQAGETPPNVLIIASDSLRHDRLGVHGHPRDVSPHIDAFARTAADFADLHVATASTLESWVTTLSSRLPPNHGVRYMYLRREQAEAASALPDLLPRVLGEAGYETIVVSDWAGNCFKLVDMGFAHNDASDTQNFTSFIMESTIWGHFVFPLYFSNPFGELLIPEVARTTKYLRPRALTQRMFDRIDDATRAGKPFFGVLFFSTTHLPYTARYPHNVRYTDPAYRGPHKYEIDVKVHELISTGFDRDLAPETIEHIRALYDGAVHEFDSHVGEVLAELSRRGLDDNTVVIITSDHGEDLYDPGSTLGHGTNFFGGDQSTRIPLLVRAPGVTRPGSTITALTRNIDLAPTIAGLVGLPPAPQWTGADLRPLLTGEASDLDLPVFGETCYLFFPKREAMSVLTDDERARLLDASGARDTLEVDDSFDDNIVVKAELHDVALATKDRMVRTRRWKLLHVPTSEGPPIYRLWDMQADPHQTTNLAGRGLSVEPQLIALLDAYWAGQGAQQRWPAANETPAAAAPPPPSPADLPAAAPSNAAPASDALGANPAAR